MDDGSAVGGESGGTPPPDGGDATSEFTWWYAGAPDRSTAQWAEVRRGWWWHVVGMLVLAPVYPLVALTVWQEPSRQPLARHLPWSLVLTASSLVVVGIPFLGVFSRRWYRLRRADVDAASAMPVDRAGRPDGVMAGTAAAGATLANRATGRMARHAPVGSVGGATATYTSAERTPRFEGPWATLVAEASIARDRIYASARGVRGPAAAAVMRHAGRPTRACQRQSRWRPTRPVSGRPSPRWRPIVCAVASPSSSDVPLGQPTWKQPSDHFVSRSSPEIAWRPRTDASATSSSGSSPSSVKPRRAPTSWPSHPRHQHPRPRQRSRPAGRHQSRARRGRRCRIDR